jgi:PAS domain S-box-containing protein
MTRESPRILLVDDIKDNLLVRKSLFQDEFPEASIACVSSAKAALQLLRAEAFDVALIDVRMPDMDGLELCQRIAGTEKTATLPILLVSNHPNDPDLRARGLQAGAVDFLSLPMNNIELVAKVRSALKLGAAVQALQTTVEELDSRVGSQSLLRARAEHQYRAVFDGIGDAVVTWCPDAGGKMGPIQSANQVALRLLEYTADGLSKVRLVELAQDATQRTEMDDLARLLREGHRIYQVRLKTASQKLIHVEVHDRIVALDKATTVVSVLRDLTARDALQHDARVFRRIADISNNGMVVAAWDGTIRYANETFARLRGKVPFALRGESLDDTTDETGARLLRLPLENLRKTRGPLAFQLRYHAKTGPVPLLVQSSCLENDRGEPDAIVLTFVDLSTLEDATRRQLETEARYRSVVENLPDALLQLSHDGTILTASAASARVLSVDATELQHKTLAASTLPPPIAHALADLVARVGTSGAMQEREITVVNARDEEAFFLCRVVPETSKGAQPPGALAIIRDTTQVRQAERDYGTLFDQALSGLAVHEMLWDGERAVDYRFIHVNPAFERLTGLARDAVIGRTIKEVLPDAEAHWIERYGNVVKTGHSVTFSATSTPLQKHFQVSAFRTGPNHFAVSFEDITDRERSLRQQERLVQLEKLLSEVSRELVGVSVQRLHAGFEEVFSRLGPFLSCQRILLLEANDASREYVLTTQWNDGTTAPIPTEHSIFSEASFPWLSNQTRATGALEILSLDDVPPTARSERNLLRALSIEAGFLIPMARNSNHLFGFLAVCFGRAQTAFPADQRMAVVSLANLLRRSLERSEVVREQERLQYRLEHLERIKAVGTLAAGVAHEVNNPINVILNYISLLKDDLGVKGETGDALTAIEESATRIAEIVQNLLVFSRQGENDAFELISPMAPAAGAQALFGHLLRQEGIDLQVASSGDLPQILASKSALQQVVVNLLTNARDALLSHGARSGRPRIRIHVARAKTDSGYVHLTIANNGPAIPETHRTRIFEPFYTTKDRTSGTGLGLSISHGIVQRHGGEILLEDNDRELAFVIQLPVPSPPQSEPTQD